MQSICAFLSFFLSMHIQYTFMLCIGYTFASVPPLCIDRIYTLASREIHRDPTINISEIVCDDDRIAIHVVRVGSFA